MRLEYVALQTAAPVSDGAFLPQGNECFRRGKYNAAIEAYTEAITLCPDVAAYYTNRAICFRRKSWDPCFFNVSELFVVVGLPDPLFVQKCSPSSVRIHSVAVGAGTG